LLMGSQREMTASIADPMKLVRDFCSLPLSERRRIAEQYGVAKGDPMEPDFEKVRRTIDAVVEQGKQVEFALLVDEAKHRADSR
jgi:hypothetical protein